MRHNKHGYENRTKSVETWKKKWIIEQNNVIRKKKLYYEIQMEMVFESMHFNEILIGFLSKGKIFRVVKLSYLIWVDGEATTLAPRD